VIISIIGKSGA